MAEQEKHKTSFKIDPDLMKWVKVKASLENITITEAVESALEQYVKDVKQKFQEK